MPAPISSKDEVLDRLLDTFRDRGYEGASLAELSAATGLMKSSLYHYFP
ncbi:MAG: helix-turn-helix domain-containing protein, partial [bacterium]